MVLTTNHFDDFVSVATTSEASAVQSCMQMFFKWLGWLFAESGDKAPDFRQVFQALGVSIHVSSMGPGLVIVGNTENRREELINFLTEVLQPKKLLKSEALRLRGRLHFASGNIFGLGRTVKSALAGVTTHAQYSSSSSLDDKACLAWP